MPSKHRSSIIKNQDVAAATFAVGPDLEVADFTSLVTALANLPAAGGSIALLDGVDETAPAGGFVQPNKPVYLTSAGKSATLRPAAGDVLFNFDFDQPFDLDNVRCQGNGSVSQAWFDIANALVCSNYIRIYGVNALNIETMFRVGASAYPCVSIVSSTLKVRDGSGLHWSGGPGSFELTDCFLTGNSGDTGGISGNPDCYFVNSFIRGSNAISVFTISASRCNFVNLGGAGITVNGTYAAFPNGFANCSFQGVIARHIDLVAAATGVAVSGCQFIGWTTEALRTASTGGVFRGNTNFEVTETGAANSNRFSDVLEGSTIIGATSIVDDWNTRTVTTTPVTLTRDDRTVLVDASGGARVVNLPTAASARYQQFTIKKIDSSVNTVTIDASGAETIDGAATAVILAQYVSFTIQSDGTTWWII